MLNLNMLKETAEHFSGKTEKKQEQTKDRWTGFATINMGGQEVIDLTSVDEGWSAYESYNRADDFSRKQLYGTQAGNPNRM